jgi:thioredoxin-related protein
MKTLRYISVLIILFTVLSSFQQPKRQKVNWISLEELKEAYPRQAKPIIIDVYTSWCGWCRVMEKETYSQESVASYINDNYYAVKFNAETKDSVEFDGKKFGYNPAYKANELAVYLLNGSMGYPTTILLSAINAQPAPLPGFLKPSELEPPLRFIGDGAYKAKEFPEYMKDFTAKW